MRPRSRLAAYLDLIRWDRPAGTLLLLWPTLSALWIAAGGFPGWHLLLVFILGTFLMRSAGCAVNDVADRDFDRHVKRTAQRPVTSGEIRPREALGLGAVLALAAFLLVLTTNLAAVAWSVVALAVALLYPFSKRVFAMPQAVLGIAFSFGIPMAFAAVRGGSWGAEAWSPGPHGAGGSAASSPGAASSSTGTPFPDSGPMPWLGAMTDAVPALAWVLLLGNLFWVLAYDTEYAMVDRDDDLRIGIKTSAITLGRFDVPAVMAFYALFLAIWAATGAWLDFGAAYFLALGAAAAIAAWHYRLIRDRSREGCFRAFRLNHWVGFTVFAGVVAAMR